MQDVPNPTPPPPETPPQPAEPAQPSQPAQPTVPPAEAPPTDARHRHPGAGRPSTDGLIMASRPPRPGSPPPAEEPGNVPPLPGEPEPPPPPDPV